MRRFFLKKEVRNYLYVGVICVIIDFILYEFLIDYTNLGLSNSKRLSYIIGASFSFILNKTITFKSGEKNITEPVLFILVYAFSFMLNSIAHDFFINIFDGYLPFLIATFLSIVVNYLGQKFLVFKK